MFELLTGSAPFQGEDIKTVENNISRLKIRWPKGMDRDAVDLISKIIYDIYKFFLIVLKIKNK